MKEKQWKFDDKHIDVLDGVRALAIFIVAWYHIWQISWKSAYFDFSWLGIERFQGMDATWFVRYGFEMVDLMLLLSGFCLFLPYARSMVYGTKEPDIKKFYKKRVARIIPSYYFAIIVALIVANVYGEYATSADMRKDLIPHLFFVHTYFKESYIWSHLNGVLWTLAIEVQFYLLFPWIAKLFKKWTVQTYFAMVAVSWMFINLQIVDKVPQEEYGMWINQLPTFFGVYANGMLASLIVVKLSQIFNDFMDKKQDVDRQNARKIIGYFFSALFVFVLITYRMMMDDIARAENMNQWQIINRYEISLLFALFIIASAFASKIIQVVLGNRVMRFLSMISFNFYIWHQFIGATCKKHYIPFWEGDTPPNELGDQAWINKCFWLCWGTALAAAIATTYLIEKPCTKLIMSIGTRKAEENAKSEKSGNTEKSDKTKENDKPEKSDKKEKSGKSKKS